MVEELLRWDRLVNWEYLENDEKFQTFLCGVFDGNSVEGKEKKMMGRNMLKTNMLKNEFFENLCPLGALRGGASSVDRLEIAVALCVDKIGYLQQETNDLFKQR